jgi:hypothetical protein
MPMGTAGMKKCSLHEHIFFTITGGNWNHEKGEPFSGKQNIFFFCGRYSFPELYFHFVTRE